MWNEGRKPEPPEDDKAWIEQKAQKMAQELARAKVDWMREPEVTARALEMLHDGLMDTLTQEWTGLTEEGIAEGRKWQEEQEETTF